MTLSSKAVAPKRWCPCCGEIPTGVTSPCEEFKPCDDPQDSQSPDDCDDCGHKVECHGK